MTIDSVVDFGVLPKLYTVADREKYLKTPFVVQVINLRHYDERTRLILYDGKYNMHALLSKELVSKLETQGFQKTSIIKILKHTCFDPVKFYTYIDDAEVVVPSYESEGHSTTKVTEYFAEHPNENFFNKEKSEPVKQAADEYQGQKISSIELLSPYQNNWVIRARVSFKGELRTWQNAKGSGKLFNVNFLDDSDEIRATAFNEIAEKMYNTLQEGKVYYVSRARIQTAKPQFSRLSHPYELSLDRDSLVEECFNNTGNIPKLKFNFTKLNLVQTAEPNSIVDVVGVLREVKPAFQITSKTTGKPFDRRDVEIVDDSNFAITVGLWNATAVDFNLSEGNVIAFKGCKVQDFAGRSLTLTQTGSILPNPDVPEAYQLKGWYDNQGSKENFQTLKAESNGVANQIDSRKTIAEAKDENLGLNEQPDFFSLKATLNFISPNTIAYPACANKPEGASNTCNRKIVEQNDGTWRCEKCDINYDLATYRYILNCSFMDASGQLWATLFDTEAAKLLGVSATEAMKVKEEGDEFAFREILTKANHREFHLRLKARQDTYNGTTRVRCQAMSLNEIDFVAECDHLVKKLEEIL